MAVKQGCEKFSILEGPSWAEIKDAFCSEEEVCFSLQELPPAKSGYILVVTGSLHWFQWFRSEKFDFEKRFNLKGRINRCANDRYLNKSVIISDYNPSFRHGGKAIIPNASLRIAHSK